MEPTEIKEQTPKEPGFSFPSAIVIAALIIGIAILASRGGAAKTKSLVAQAGVSESKVSACYAQGTFKDKVQAFAASGAKVFAHLPEDERGTPYSVLVSKNGVKLEVKGNYPEGEVSKMIDSLLAGTAKDQPEIALDPITDNDHIRGSKDADVIIVEYGDFDCAFCTLFHPTVESIMAKYGTKVAWVYRHFPLDNLHPNARPKAETSECVYSLGGDTAFWKYVDANFKANLEKIKPTFDPLN